MEFPTSDYSPNPEHKFTFGLWTVGLRGADPFGSTPREHKTPAGDFDESRTPPDPVQVEAYHEACPLYRQLSPALKPSFEEMV
jgi:hypothetical protein